MEYEYIAYTTDSSVTRGTQSAADAETATKALTARGLRILTLKPVPAFMPRWGQMFTRVGPEVIVAFFRHLAVLLEGGTDIVTSLQLIRFQTTNRGFKNILGTVISDLRKGDRLSTALGRFPTVFPKMCVQSIAVGEKVGGVETMLRRMSDHLDKDTQAMKSIKSSLRYPIVVTAVACVVVGILTIFVLPQFVNLYSDLGAKLPTITRVTLGAMTWLADYGPYVFGTLPVAAALIYFYSRTPQGKLQIDTMMLRMPVLGRIITLGELDRCCRGTSMLHGAGMPLPEIISLVTDTSSNAAVKRALTDVHRDLLKGDSMSASMTRHKEFLPMMVQMVAMGEATGTLDATLTSTATSFEMERDDRTKSMIGMIQPAVTLVLGILVAAIALSLVSAMYSMFGQVS